MSELRPSRYEGACAARALGRSIALACALGVLLLPDRLPAAPEATEARVILKSGTILEGRVVATESVAGEAHARIDTDFGQILVPQRHVASQAVPPARPDAAFVARTVWVAGYEGTVERRAAQSSEWKRIDWHQAAYGTPVNAPNAHVRPGDHVRTGPGSWVELMLHRDVWIRLRPESEIEIPGELAAKASLKLLAGGSVHHVNGRPRGTEFRLATPGHVLGVRGTWFAAHVGLSSALIVKQGSVVIDKTHPVMEGQRVALLSPHPPPPTPWLDGDGADFEIEPLTLPRAPMLYIPGGHYVLTATRGPEEHPAFGTLHRAKVEQELTEFLIDVDEVTVEDYNRFQRRFQSGPLPPRDREMLDLLVPAAPSGAPEARLQALDSAARPEARRVDYGPPRAPAHGFGWHSASSYARWCGRNLPTELQWEVAARGRQSRVLPWGDALPKDARRELDETTWTRSDDNGFVSIYWAFHRVTPRTVDEPTLDVSVWGVEGLVTRGPEYVRDWWDRSPFHLGLTEPPFLATCKVVRGAEGSTRNRMPWRPTGPRLRGTFSPAFRCVIELR